jgi:hypothetical protein
MTYWYTVVLNLSHKLTYISNYNQEQLRPARLLNFGRQPTLTATEAQSFLEKLTVAQRYRSLPTFFFKNPKVYCRFRMSLSTGLVLNQINPANAFTKYFPNAIWFQLSTYT